LNPWVTRRDFGWPLWSNSSVRRLPRNFRQLAIGEMPSAIYGFDSRGQRDPTICRFDPSRRRSRRLFFGAGRAVFACSSIGSARRNTHPHFWAEFRVSPGCRGLSERGFAPLALLYRRSCAHPLRLGRPHGAIAVCDFSLDHAGPSFRSEHCWWPRPRRIVAKDQKLLSRRRFWPATGVRGRILSLRQEAPRVAFQARAFCWRSSSFETAISLARSKACQTQLEPQGRSSDPCSSAKPCRAPDAPNSLIAAPCFCCRVTIRDQTFGVWPFISLPRHGRRANNRADAPPHPLQ